jgi:hypothetical protein
MWWFIIQLALGATALAGAETEGSAQPGPQGPRIIFAEPVFDFGKIKADDIVRHEFVFTNAGAGLLEISRVAPGCGCTTTTVREMRVAPGKTGVIPIEFNPRGLNGPISRPIQVFANDPTRGNPVLRIRAEVWTPVEAQPGLVVFNHNTESPKRETKVVRVVNHFDHPVEVSVDAWTNRSFEAALKTVRPGKEFALEITSVRPLEPGTVILPLRLKTSAPEVPSLTVNICANEQPTVVVAPRRLTLPAGPLHVPERRAVAIRNLGREPLFLSGLELDLPGAAASVHEVKAGREFSIVVTFAAGFAPPANATAELRVRSNHPRFPVIKVPLTAAPGLLAAQP